MFQGALAQAGDPDSPSPSIDSILLSHYKTNKIEPSPLCSDHAFLRRVTLDLAGRIPNVAEIESFAAAPDRNNVIDRLLASDEFAKSSSELWTATLAGYGVDDETDRDVLREWLHQQFKQDIPYTEIAKALITASGSTQIDGPTNFLMRHREDPAVKLGRMFLGVRLDCAQCHDHPFDRWTQEDYKSMQLFFSRMDFEDISSGYRLVDYPVDEETEEKPVFLTGARPRTTQWRREFAMFATRSKPFARTFGNRIWYQLVGRGIVDPPDDFSGGAEIPELVELLADQARQQEFSVKEMVRLICRSDAYQRSSSQIGSTPDSRRSFAVKPLKPMTPEQFYDSAMLGLGISGQPEQREEFIERATGRNYREDFSETWKYRETVQIALSRLSFKPQTEEMPLDNLYLRLLGRKPTDRERKLCREKTNTAIVFALLNSNEFFFNH